MNDDLIGYIVRGREQGLTDEQIRKNLQSSGWGEVFITSAFKKSLTKKPEDLPSTIAPAITSSKKRSTIQRRWLQSGLLLAIVCLIVGSYAFAEYGGIIDTTFFVNRAETTWEKFLASAPSVANNITIATDYQDAQNSKQDTSSLTIRTTGYMQTDKSLLTDATGTMAVKLATSGKQVLIDVPFQYQNGLFYFDAKSIIHGPNADPNTSQWVSSTILEPLRQTFGVISQAATWANNPAIVLEKKFSGWETVGEHPRAGKYTLTLNGEAIRSKIGLGGNLQAQQLTISSIDIWIDRYTYQPVKLTFTTTAPSIQNIQSLIQKKSDVEAADLERLTEARQLANALELHYNAHSGYPASDNGRPVGLEKNYLAEFPTAPISSGVCNDYANTYWYTKAGKQGKSPRTGEQTWSSYTFTFCLEHATNGLKAGLATMTPSGITTTTSCPEGQAGCFSPEAVGRLFDPTKPLDFSGSADWIITLEPTDIKQTGSVPESSIPFQQFLKNLASTLQKSN
jgi:hypothetical protein